MIPLQSFRELTRLIILILTILLMLIVSSQRNIEFIFANKLNCNNTLYTNTYIYIYIN